MSRVHAEHAGTGPGSERREGRCARAGPDPAVLALQRTAGNRAVVRLLARREKAPTGYPWVGRIKPWSAALRAAPSPPAGPKTKVLADLPRGSEVKVVNRKSGWLEVEVVGAGLSGYVSRELVEFDRMSAFDVGPVVVSVKVPSVGEALITLKRVEKRREAAGGALKPSEDGQGDADVAISVLRGTGR